MSQPDPRAEQSTPTPPLPPGGTVPPPPPGGGTPKSFPGGGTPPPPDRGAPPPGGGAPQSFPGGTAPPPGGGVPQSFPGGAGPAEPPAAGARRGRLGLVVVAVAALALLVSLGSAVVSWRALDQAQTARDIASARGPVGSTDTAPAPSDPPAAPTDAAPTPTVPEDSPRPPGTPPDVRPEAVYEVEYESQTLTLKPADCFTRMSVDLDEPRANVAVNGSEFFLDPNCQGGAPVIKLRDGAQGSETTTAMKPGECFNAIRSAPIAENADVPLRKGSWLCLSTNYAAAQERRDRWRMVLMEVISINNDRTVVIRATAWNIPED
ncbi:hypothetical protein [Micromonospora orduensis]|uniref:hypothetical protein n=1 Tax=Micromonospora orduensis TaxID=1420891 RepID=UPI0033DDD639